MAWIILRLIKILVGWKDKPPDYTAENPDWSRKYPYKNTLTFKEVELYVLHRTRFWEEIGHPEYYEQLKTRLIEADANFIEILTDDDWEKTKKRLEEERWQTTTAPSPNGVQRYWKYVFEKHDVTPKYE